MRVVGTYVRTMDSIPPPAPARAWATLSFCGITGLEAILFFFSLSLLGVSSVPEDLIGR